MCVVLRQHRGPRTAAGDLDQEMRRAFDRPFLPSRIDPTLESLGSIRDEAVTARNASNHIRREECTLEEHIGSIDSNAAFLSAHDAGESDRTGGVRDDESVRRKLDIATVEKLQALAGTGIAHLDMLTQSTQVVGVQRLAQLEHHVVGDVDNGADRAQSRAAQALAHPERRASRRIDTLYDATRETRATGRRFESHRKFLARCLRHRLGWRMGELARRDGGDLPRDAEHRQHVAAIRGHVERQDRVVEQERLAQRRARHEFVRQLEDSFVLFGKPEFACRAQHARRLDAAEPRLPDHFAGSESCAFECERRLHAGAHIGRAADDLQASRAAGRDLADGQLVGTRMLLDGQHFPDDDALEIARSRLDRFDLDPAHRETRGQRSRVHAGIHPFAEPGKADAHAQPRLNCARKRRSFSKNMRRSLTA